MHAEDKSLWANNGERFNHDPGPRQQPREKLSGINPKLMEPIFIAPGLAMIKKPGEDKERILKHCHYALFGILID